MPNEQGIARRNSHLELFYKKVALENFSNFAKFTEKNLFLSLLFNKVADLGPVTLLKMKLRYRCFPVNFAKFSEEHLFYRTPPMAASVNIAKSLSIYNKK